MNRERLTDLRDFVTTIPAKQFDMREVHEEHECGTVACIAGWACEMAGLLPICTQSAADWLGLTEEQRGELFFAYLSDTPLGAITVVHAIAAIQSMLDNPSDDALPVWPEVAL